MKKCLSDAEDPSTWVFGKPSVPAENVELKKKLTREDKGET